MRIDKNTKIYLGQREIVKIKKGNIVIWEGESTPVVEPDYFYIENTYAGSNTLSIVTSSAGTVSESLYTKTIEYSKDKSNWTTINLTSSTETITLNQGEKVYFRNDNGKLNYMQDASNRMNRIIRTDYSSKIGGNLMTIVNYRNIDAALNDGVFSYLFNNNSGLVDASELNIPSKQPSTNCYRRMFRDCTSLTIAPTLKATTLENSCYNQMFSGCLLLKHIVSYANDISATSCLSNWLQDTGMYGVLENMGTATYTASSDSGLRNTWSEIKGGYFYMKNTYDGTNTVHLLTTKVGSPSSSTYGTNMEYSKNRIDWTTVSLDDGGDISISLNKDESVYFRNDTGLLNIWTSDSSSYRTIFRGSYINNIGGNINTLLDYTNASSVTIPRACFMNIFNSANIVDASDLKMPSQSLNTECFRNMFRGNSTMTVAPALPATTLGTGSYYSMFQDCTSLTTAPTLPATTLTQNCYRGMFRDCTSLNEVIVYADSLGTNSTTDWLNGVAASGTFRNLGSASYPSGTSGIPSGWTEVNS